MRRVLPSRRRSRPGDGSLHLPSGDQGETDETSPRHLDRGPHVRGRHAGAAQVTAGGGLILAAGGDVADFFDLGLEGGVFVGLPDALPRLRVGGDFQFYFPQTEGAFGVTARGNLLALNGSAHYTFVTEPGFEVYGLGGLTWTRFSISGNGESWSDTDIGLHLGAGTEFPMGFGRIYAELKVVTGTYDRLVLGGGLRLGL